MYYQQQATAQRRAPVNIFGLGTLYHCAGALLLLLFSVYTATAQINFTELDKKMSQEKRYVVVCINSKYCTYCLMQEAQMKKNNTLRQRMDSGFYFVKTMAESDSAIVFNHRKYINPNPEDPYQVNDFVNIYGKHGKGFVGYPLWLYFDKDYRLVLRFYGLMPPKNILKVLDIIEKVDALDRK
ncbi:MAG: thioredoxin fold domain-containing protein [Chitinophagaceae bacterium]